MAEQKRALEGNVVLPSPGVSPMRASHSKRYLPKYEFETPVWLLIPQTRARTVMGWVLDEFRLIQKESNIVQSQRVGEPPAFGMVKT
jgi:hypothetical protein